MNVNSSALPDYVFDEGEKQPKLAQKRPKTTKVRLYLLSICYITEAHRLRHQGLG